MRSRISALAFVAILVITSCTRGGSTAAKASPTPASPGRVVWTSCGGAFQCGTVQVPLDYAHPSAGTIDIALNRKPATDPAKRIGSVLINPGGPGASGINFLKGEASAMKALNQYFDLVGFDPRGVGLSAPVRCLDGPQEDAFNAIDTVLDDPLEKQATFQAAMAYTAACEQRNASILPFVDTVSAAKDMDIIRAAVGDAKLTYFGFSYGTFLGQTYAHLFPTHVRALALDGVVDPSLTLDDLNLAQVVSFEQNLQAFLTDCVARRSAPTPCRYAESGDPGTKLMALMRRVDANPIPVGTRQLTRSIAMYGVLLSLYDQSFWPYLDQGLYLADRGNGAVLMALSDVYFSRHTNGTYDNELDANWAVNCLDRPVLKDIAAYDRLGPVFAQASPLFGPWSQYSNIVCADWPVPPTGHPGPLTADGAPPILLVGGTDDPATPYAWAQAVNRNLANSVLLTRQGNGHTSYDVSTCAHAATDAYLISLTLPAPGTICSQ